MKPSPLAAATVLLLALMVRTARADEPAPEGSAPAPAEQAAPEAEASEAQGTDPEAAPEASPEERPAMDPSDAAEPAPVVAEVPAEDGAAVPEAWPPPTGEPARVIAPALAPPPSPSRVGRAPDEARRARMAVFARPADLTGPADADRTDRARARDGDDGPLGPVRLGLLAGAGVPSMVSGQVLLTYKGWVGLSADYGALPTITLPVGDGFSFEHSQTTLAARVHPFHGAFFLGCGLGAARGRATARSTASGITGDVSMTANTVYVMPQLGLLHRFSFGLAIGMDAGVELPVSSSTSVEATAQGTPLPVPGGVADVVAMASKQPIPVLNLLRLGYVL